MILTDTDLSKVLETSRNVPNASSVIINPFEERCLTPVGYDLRTGNRYQLLHEGVVHKIESGEEVIIPPGETVSIQTLEWIAMPSDGSISGFICSRVMLVATGASHISTTVDPDWIGNLLISFTNHSRTEIILPFGERICTMVLMENKSRSKKLSQHAPGRPDALNKNASRIAEIYKKDQMKKFLILYLTWIAFGIAYSGIVYWTHLNYGANSLFVSLVAAGVILFGFGIEVIKYLLIRN